MAEDEVETKAASTTSIAAMATEDKAKEDDDSDEIVEHHPLVIVGGGIGGLVLALCLDQVYNHGQIENNSNSNDGSYTDKQQRRRRPHLPIHVYESTSTYTSNAGGAIGLYPNGIRVLRHLSQTHPALSKLSSNVRMAGCDYLYRRWMRHDGFEVAVAREDELLPDVLVDETLTTTGAATTTTMAMAANSNSISAEIEEENEVDEKNDDTKGTNLQQPTSPSLPQKQQQPQQSMKPPRSRHSSILSLPLPPSSPSSSTSSNNFKDKAGERANRRPRGGTFRVLQNSFQNLTIIGGGAGPTASGTAAIGTTGTVAFTATASGISSPSEHKDKATPTTTAATTTTTSSVSSITTSSPRVASSSIAINSSGSGGGGSGRRSTTASSDSNTTTNSTNRWREALKSFGENAKTLVGSSAASRRSSSTSTTSSSNANSSAASTPASPRVIIETELLSLGIRRWKYQQILYEACCDAGIQIHFGKRLQSVVSLNAAAAAAAVMNNDVDAGMNADVEQNAISNNNGDGPRTLLQFKDGTKITTSLLIGADGINSRVRKYVTHPTIIPSMTTTTTTATTIANIANEQSLTIKKEKEEEEYVPAYTGVTCLMGCANVPRPVRGICFPSSATTKCHACYYPTRIPSSVIGAEGGSVDPSSGKPANNGDNNDDDNYEQVFQIYFPSPIERPDTWRTLTPEEAKEECRSLAAMLRKDGWHEQFLMPLESPTLTGVLRVGLRSRDGLDCWHVGGGDGGGDAAGSSAEDATASFAGGEGAGDDKNGTPSMKQQLKQDVGCAVLLGDAAHPPVPYIGQGAMMAMEDAGTLSLLLGHYCPVRELDNECGTIGGSQPNATTVSLDLSQFSKAMSTYESVRVSRTKAILGSSVALGKTQQKRADSILYNAWREMSIRAQVWAYGTLPVMRPGAAFDYKAVVEETIGSERVMLDERS
jgi:2-polyprenyl-6-methoxyphenol hydroxylase-like FAD-dependent oxidoreductase